MRNYRKSSPARELTPEDQEAWREAILARVGTSLRYASDIYADQNGRVYAGSEYVARLGATTAPEDATEWTTAVNAIDYGRGRA